MSSEFKLNSSLTYRNIFSEKPQTFQKDVILNYNYFIKLQIYQHEFY